MNRRTLMLLTIIALVGLHAFHSASRCVPELRMAQAEVDG